MASTPPPTGWLSDNTKWIAATIIIPLVTWIAGYQLERRERIRTQAEQNTAREERRHESAAANARNDVAAITALLPTLTTSEHGRAALALTVLTRLRDAQSKPLDDQERDAIRIRAFFDGLTQQIEALGDSDKTSDKNLAARSSEIIQNARPSTQQSDATPNTQPVTPAQAAKAQPQKPSRVYLHIFDEGQRSQAQSVQTLLRDQAVPVPGIENVSRLGRGTLPRQQIRYFNRADLGAASWTQEQLKVAGYGEFTIFPTHARGGVPAGQIEIWWSNSPSPPTG